MNRISWKDLNIKERIGVISAVIAFFLGWFLTISGFFVDPIGEVSDSVLWILGQALIYTASVFGIATYFNSEQKELKRYFDSRMHGDNEE